MTVLLGDPRLPDESKPGGAYTADDHVQIARLREALATLSQFEFDWWDDHTTLLDRLRNQPPEFVLNFCDTGFRNQARRELHVPALLELLNVPYSGSGPVALGLCYDKALVRAVAAAAGVPVPDEVLLRGQAPLPEFRYPAFIKPNTGDGSLGITEASIVADAVAAADYVADLRRLLPGRDVLVQEFLSGTEYGLGLVGNPGAGFTVLPALEVDYAGLDPKLGRLLTYSSKTDPDSPYWNDIAFRPARLTWDQIDSMTNWCTVLFDRLQLRDYGRFDFRADPQGQIKLIEVNPNPAWCWDGKLAHMAGLSGRSHGDLLGLIVDAAFARTGA